jgi:hypothetical protein
MIISCFEGLEEDDSRWGIGVPQRVAVFEIKMHHHQIHW